MKGKNYSLTKKSASIYGDVGGDILKQGSILISHRLPYNPKLKDRAKELRKNITPAEKYIYENYFKKLNNIRVLRQRPIDNYIVDFYIAKYKLVIEIDGEIHNHRIEYDAQRTCILEGHGLQLVRFTNKEIFENFDSVCEQLNKVLNR